MGRTLSSTIGGLGVPESRVQPVGGSAVVARFLVLFDPSGEEMYQLAVDSEDRGHGEPHRSQTHTRRCAHTSTYTNMHTFMRTLILIHLHTYTHMHTTHAHTHSHTQNIHIYHFAHMFTHTHSHPSSHTHTDIYSFTHTNHTHRQTFTHSLALMLTQRHSSRTNSLTKSHKQGPGI